MSEPAATDHDGAFSFRAWPFYWLARAGGRYVQAMELELRPVGLDVPRWRVLMTLHEEGCLSVSQIADYAIAKLPTMTRIIQRMEADGLVVCRAGERDARVTEVTLTDSGRLAGQLAWRAANRVLVRALEGITPDRVEALIAVLRDVAENLSDP